MAHSTGKQTDRKQKNITNV